MDSGGGSGGGVGDVEDRSEVEMGMGAESFSIALHIEEPVVGMDSGKAVKNSTEFPILGHFPNNYLVIK